MICSLIQSHGTSLISISRITAVSSKWLQQMYSQHKDDLFSGNPRNYLGSGKKKNKINLGIKESIINEPNNFWAYNNGITALVTDYETDENTNHLISITGITVINGAQTTGAIGSLEESAKDAWVPIRFIVCRDEKIIEEIIANNNKQNEILPSDLRSNDATQNRLRDEFKAFPNYFYSGGRRGELNPYRSKEIFDPYLVAQSLLSFHGDCVTAYNSKNELWNDDKLYSSIFSEKLTASHIIFVYALLRAIDSYKLELHNSFSHSEIPSAYSATFFIKLAFAALFFSSSSRLRRVNSLSDSSSSSFFFCSSITFLPTRKLSIFSSKLSPFFR